MIALGARARAVLLAMTVGFNAIRRLHTVVDGDWRHIRKINDMS